MKTGLQTGFAVLLLGTVLGPGLAACKRQDMYTQNKVQTWDRTAFFSDQSGMREPVAGTAARDEQDLPVQQPSSIDAAMLQRGQRAFNIFCSPCHGRAGDGEGMIVQRGFPHPPSFHSTRLRDAKAAHFYDVITHGHGAMYSYASRLSPADRWAVVAYVRALQESQDADVDQLGKQDRAKLAGTP